MDEPEDKKVLLSLRRSRKAFIPEYTCGFILLAVLAGLKIQQISVGSPFQFFVLGVALLALIAPEISRQLIRYSIKPDKITITKGIIKKSQKNVHYLPLGFVPDISLKQSRTQRLMNYGTVFVGGQGSEEKSFEIKDINNPKHVLKMIEGLIDKNRRVDQKVY
ncbi:PH domain-containing protein [Candidatus Woesearchaeota archaeon]|nr:PH domain-containing protein [Candidatus Woesearchaeota archaeon]